MAGLAAGRLDRRIRLERFTATKDPASNEQIRTWSPLATVWALHRRASARETLAASELSAATSDVFEIRWDSAWADLSPLDRVIYGGRVHEIVGVSEKGRREGLRIDTVARAGAIA